VPSASAVGHSAARRGQIDYQREPVRGSSNSKRILKPMTSAPKRILSSLIPKAKFFGGDATGPTLESSGNLQEKLQCGHAAGISRMSSGETVSRDLHWWHSNEIARISSRPTTIFRSNVTLPKCITAEQSERSDARRSTSSASALNRARHGRRRNRVSGFGSRFGFSVPRGHLTRRFSP
jgi:hypothetical protein